MTRAQAVAAGLSAGQIKRRISRGALQGVHRGVYAVGHSRLTPEGRLLAAVLVCGPAAVASHRSAAAHWGLVRSAGSCPQVSVPSGAASWRRTVALHRTALAGDEVTVHRAIPVTTPPRTLLDLAGSLPRAGLERAVERAEELRLFDLGAVEAALAAHPRRRGRRALLEILAHWTAPALTRSELERRFLELCAEARLPAPQVNVRVGPYEVDFAWATRRVIVETDGHSSHGTRAAFERDRARDAWLQAAGWRVVRFTYRQVVAEAAVVAEVLRSLLRGA